MEQQNQQQHNERKTYNNRELLERNPKYRNPTNFYMSNTQTEHRYSSADNDSQQSEGSQQQRLITTNNPTGGPFDGLWKPERLEQFWLQPIPSVSMMEMYAWNPNDCSSNIFIGTDPFTLHRLPIAQSTDAIRGKVGFSKGFHVWEIVWPAKRRGTHAVIGVGTKAAKLHSCGYMSLVGADDESFGWDIVSQKCFHGSTDPPWIYPNIATSGDSTENTKIPDRILCILDMDSGYLAFSSLQQYYGVAFTGLKGRTLFPMISAVWGHCEIKMLYMGGLPAEPRSLKDICRAELRTFYSITKLELLLNKLQPPKELIKYLLH